MKNDKRAYWRCPSDSKPVCGYFVGNILNDILRSAVQICPAAPKSFKNLGFRDLLFLNNERAEQFPDPHADKREKNVSAPDRKFSHPVRFFLSALLKIIGGYDLFSALG